MSPLASAVCLFLRPSLSLNEVGEACLVKRRGIMCARVAFGDRRVLVVGRVSEWS
jgi:hypothetical protein